MIVSVHQAQYIPWIGYFDKIDKSDRFVFLDQVQYKAREFQNRNKIRTKDGWIWLTVPVVSKGLGRQKISEIKIDNSTDWRNEHWRSLESCYNRAPYFKDYAVFFKEIYASNIESLMELNIRIIEYLFQSLGIDTPIDYESKIGTTAMSTERIIEICQKLKADTYLSGSGGKGYLEEEKFNQVGIKLEYQVFEHPVYKQQFMQTPDSFLPYMSILDLLFNHGKASLEILRGKK